MLATLDSHEAIMNHRLKSTKEKLQKEMIALMAVSTIISISFTLIVKLRLFRQYTVRRKGDD